MIDHPVKAVYRVDVVNHLLETHENHSDYRMFVRLRP